MDGRDDLPEEVSRLAVAQATPLADVVVELALTGVLHHDDDLVLVLEHWRAEEGGGRDGRGERGEKGGGEGGERRERETF